MKKADTNLGRSLEAMVWGMALLFCIGWPVLLARAIWDGIKWLCKKIDSWFGG